jgi:hypothetical protein
VLDQDDPGRLTRAEPPRHLLDVVLRKAFRGAGGRMIGEGFLTPETIRAVEPQLAAISDAIAAAERGGTPP